MCFLQIILELQPYVNCQVCGKSRGYQHQNAHMKVFFYILFIHISVIVFQIAIPFAMLAFISKKQKEKKKVKSMPELMKPTQPSDL